MKHHKSSITIWLRLAVLLLCSVFAVPAAAQVTQRQKITSEPRGVGAQFGNAVAISGNTMVVGARFDSTTASQAGAAFVYVLNGTTWTQQAKLLANDGATLDKFGQSVAISGDTIVVGAYQDDSPLSNGGSAYVFVRNGTTWTQQQKLTATDGTADDEFGNAVAIVSDTLVIGAHFADLPSNSAAGAAYRFTRSGTVWTEVQKLTPSGATLGGNQFGESLAVSGDKLVVGSDHDDTPETAAGAVYVFVDSGAAYGLQQKLTIGDGTNGDLFGFSVAIEGNTLVGGAREDTPIIGQTAFGAAYVFEFNGATWTLQQKLTASDGASVDRFGWSVAVDENVVVVGAREDDTTAGPDAGSAYLFTRSGTTWTEQEKITPDDPFNGDRFGASVALSADNLVVGAAEKNLTSPNGQGAAYSFSTRARSVFPDFDGDGKADLSFFRPSDFTWRVIRSSDGATSSDRLGIPGVLIAPADYDGDRKTERAVFDPSTGNWCMELSSNGFIVCSVLGATGDLPVPGDFDGDGLADLAVFRPSTGLWLIRNSSNSQVVSTTFGSSTDKPLIGDFDGDGKSDISIYRPSTGEWFILGSSNSTIFIVQFGLPGDIPAPADYDGDGKTDTAVFRNGTWFILQSSNSTSFIIQWGISSDFPVPADYDGDGKADVAVYRFGTWYILRSETSTFFAAQFGASGDRPVPLFFVRQPLASASLQFSATNYPVNEDPTSAVITVTRTGDSSNAVSVSYATSDGSALQTSDYSNALGILTFASGETSKTFTVPISEDSFVEGTETATLTLSSPTGGAVLGSQSTATLTILDDATEPSANTIDVPGPYVSQHYHDFLNRDGDAAGLAFWTDQITSCGNDAQCIGVKRVNVSAAYFLSIEFQQTGYLVYRFYNAALNRSNGLPRYAEFLRDTQGVGRGVVVNVAGWEAVLEANKVAYANEFVASAEFKALYPLTQTPAVFVDSLYTHAGIVPTAAERQAAIDEFNNNPSTAQARVLRRVAEHPALVQREFNRAFVLMQYFGYLRRNPDDAPDNNLSGYNFWLAKLNQFNGDFVAAEMVKAFIQSGEYRRRFGQ
ncbi:MAG: FG-GAP-like repeat-containing protein [Pyrinomonadaceae bacterium]|nr:FG-GAP-like repeat-containing protein [Pyrinomonadaceae bacterium]